MHILQRILTRLCQTETEELNYLFNDPNWLCVSPTVIKVSLSNHHGVRVWTSRQRHLLV